MPFTFNFPCVSFSADKGGRTSPVQPDKATLPRNEAVLNLPDLLKSKDHQETGTGSCTSAFDCLFPANNNSGSIGNKMFSIGFGQANQANNNNNNGLKADSEDDGTLWMQIGKKETLNMKL